MYAEFTLLLNIHMVVELETANRKVGSLEKNMNALEIEKKEQSVGKYRTIKLVSCLLCCFY